MNNKIDILLYKLTHIKNKFKIIDIIEYLLKKFNYKIEEDFLYNDLRTIYFKNDNDNDLKITSIIIIDKYDNIKKDYIKIYYMNKVYEYYCNY